MEILLPLFGCVVWNLVVLLAGVWIGHRRVWRWRIDTTAGQDVTARSRQYDEFERVRS